MCRWLAYAGPPIYLDSLLTKPDHSLIDQSFQARQNYVPGAVVTTQFRHHEFPTNADGFGVGWYGTGPGPGLYKDVRPAWGDENLHRLAEQIRAPLFLAHVRATLGGTIARANCHPFLHDGWLYQFNGEISGYDRLRRELATEVAPELYSFMSGDADTELCFFLALTFGLRHDPVGALARMVGRVEHARREHGVEEPFRATMAATDGTTVWAVRYSSDRDSKTLYRNHGPLAIRQLDGSHVHLHEGAHVLVSEPLEVGYNAHHWIEIPEWTMLTVRAGEDVRAEPFEPQL